MNLRKLRVIASRKFNMTKNKKEEEVIVSQNNTDHNKYGTVIFEDSESENNERRRPSSLLTTTIRTAAGNMKHFAIAAILSTTFSYSCIMSTFFLLTGPIECQRIEHETRKYYSFTISKSIALGGFAAIAGLAQLITPLIGLISDCYMPNGKYSALQTLGRRMPYLILGTILTVLGLFGQIWASSPIHPVTIEQSHTPDENLLAGLNNEHSNDVAFCGAWFQYSLFFLLSMLGINIVYTITIVLIPDLVPKSQTGIANGTLALQVVCGSLFGFFFFHILRQKNVMDMYKMYCVVSIVTAVLTCSYVLEREDALKKVSPDYDYDYDSRDVNTESEDEKEEEKVETIFNDHQIQTFQRNKDNNTASSEEYIPPFHTVIYLLLYEPIMNKSRSEMIAAYWIDTSEHRDFFIVTISRFFYYMGISSQTFFLYFIHDVLRRSTRTENPEAAVALLAIIGQSSGAITCYPVGILSDQYFNGRRKPFVYTACVLLSIGNIALLKCKTLKEMIGVCILLGASNGMYLTMDTSLAVDTLDVEVEEDDIGEDIIDIYESNRTPTHHENSANSNNDHGAAQLLGVWGVFGFIGSALGPLIGGTSLLVLGSISSNNPGIMKESSNSTQGFVLSSEGTTNSSLPSYPFYNIHGYEALFSLSAFYFFCSALSLGFVKKKGV